MPDVADASARALAAFSRAAARLGFADAADLTARISRRIAADCPVWLLLPRAGGRSFAIPADLTDLPGVTLAVCYAREANFPEPLAGPPFADPITLVHEILHLFGATDKYGVSLASFPPKLGDGAGRDVPELRVPLPVAGRSSDRSGDRLGRPGTRLSERMKEDG